MKRSALAVALLVLWACAASAQQSTAARPSAPGESPTSNRVLLDLLNQVDALGRQMRELRGELEEMSNKVEVLNDRMQKSEKRQSDLYNDTDARLRRIEQLAKDDAEARKKLTTLIGEIDLRLKKLEGAPGAAAAPGADLDARLKKLEAAAAATPLRRPRQTSWVLAGRPREVPAPLPSHTFDTPGWSEAAEPEEV